MSSRRALLVALVCAHSVTAEISFSRKPAVTKVADGWRIEFAVSAPTDVEVAILNTEGRIVNHLAAGVLGGPNPPPPPLRPGLAQELLWDGKDDKGNPVSGSMQVRVRAGLKPEFEEFMLYNPHASGHVLAIVPAPGGQIYVFHKH
ncbi:MAG: hypothetical protein N2255_08470, partial [Kiritimatiellae bacterium]|nr:hypothetical protein [Kiritimatiellia bacterium]